MAMRFWLLFFLVGSLARAEVYITVTGANVKRAKLALGSLRPQQGPGDGVVTAKLAKQLRDDLELMNLFDFIEPSLFANLDTSDLSKIRYPDWTPFQASFVLRVGYRMGSGKITLEGMLYDIPGEKRIFGKTYTFPADQWQKMVHSLSEEILHSITGEKGLFTTRIVMACASSR